MGARKNIVSTILCAAMVALLTVSARAFTEKEPNDTPEQANQIHPSEIVSGVLQDSFDYFAIKLPATGKTTVSLSGCPRGGQVQIGAKGFGYNGWQNSNGKETVSLTFDARQTGGLIWVMPTFAGSVCGSDWCASQFIAGGPFHVTEPSPHVPGSFQNSPILAPVEYTLVVTQAAAQSRQTLPSASKPASAWIDVKNFTAGGGSLLGAKIKIRAQGYGDGAQLLKLFAVEVNGEILELQSRPCRNGAVVDFNAVYDRFKTRLFELKLYNHKNQVIASFQREV